MGPRACSTWRTWFTYSAFCLLLWPFSNGVPVPTSPSWSQEPRGKALAEAWRRCGNVVLDPKDSKWSCCGLQYPFHRGSQRCCSTYMKEFRVIPKDNSKSEYEDCRTYNRKDL